LQVAAVDTIAVVGAKSSVDWSIKLPSDICVCGLCGTLRGFLEDRGRAGTSEVLTLFVFDPARNAVLLVAGDKSG